VVKAAERAQTKGQVVAHFSSEIVSLLKLSIPAGAQIVLSDSTIKHIEKSHPDVCHLIDEIPEIMSAPDYVGYSLKKNTVDFIRTGKMRIRIPVRPSSDCIYFVRSMFKLHKRDFERLIRSGSIFLLESNKKLL